MSDALFVEALSADPYVKELHRRAIRLLNDPTLDWEQRAAHIRRLQGRLVEHQVMQAAKDQKVADKRVKREQVSRSERKQGVADPMQVVARRREFGHGQGRQQTKEPVVEVNVQPVGASNDNHLTGRSRPVLTLRRA